MVVICEIEFDNNPHGIYFAGQVLSGKVTLTADKLKQVRGISLRITGYAMTNWTESKSRNVTDSQGKSTTESYNVNYYGKEDYIASLTYLLGTPESDTTSIEPGIHTYNFACHIPTTCPSSFEGTYGRIRYLIKITLIRPWKFDQTYTKGFTVLKVMDLNYDSPIIRVPTNVEIEKTFCCGPCRTDPLKMEVSLAQSGFVPGQNIPLTVTITNDSRIPVEELEITLLMLVHYYSQFPYRAVRYGRVPVIVFKGDGVLRHCKKQFQYEIPVPATPPTCLNLCRLIQITYEVTVEAKVKGMHANQVIGTPVVIGNVPLMGIIQQQPKIMQRDILNKAATEGTSNNVEDIEMSHMMPMNGGVTDQRESTVPWSADANIPPPSYEEATHVPRACINADEKHDYGESDFAPRYPVFKISSTINTTSSVENVSCNVADEVDSGKTGDGTWL